VPLLPPPLRRLLSRAKRKQRDRSAPPDLGTLLVRPIAPDGTGAIGLAELLAALHSAPERQTHTLAARYVGAVRTATLDCLRAQRHLFGAGDPAARAVAIERLADSLYRTGAPYWRRFDLDQSVVEAVGPDLLAAIVSATIGGAATLGLEGRVYEVLSGSSATRTPRAGPHGAAPQALPTLRHGRDRHRRASQQ
jgi:hypothetical protein